MSDEAAILRRIAAMAEPRHAITCTEDECDPSCAIGGKPPEPKPTQGNLW